MSGSRRSVLEVLLGAKGLRVTGLLLIFFAGSYAAAGTVAAISVSVTGKQFTYSVKPNDSLTSVGARYGVEVSVLAGTNQLPRDTRLVVGQKLIIDTRHIVPGGYQHGIVINVPQRMLFYFQDGELMSAFPVAVGRPDCPTPIGDFRIVNKERNPVWNVPESIQEDMRREGRFVRTMVPPCPENPLGEFWMGLSAPGVGIHGTNAPSSIYSFVTHACIRLHPDDVQALFDRVQIGAPVSIIYQPVLLASVDGAFYLEVHRDPYRKNKNTLRSIQALAGETEISDRIDWDLVRSLLRKREGTARRVNARTAIRLVLSPCQRCRACPDLLTASSATPL